MEAKETNWTKIEKPYANFDSPRTDPALSMPEKVEAPEMLGQEARLLSTTAEEGMTGGEETKLHDVLNAHTILKGRTDAPAPGSEGEATEEIETQKLDP